MENGQRESEEKGELFSKMPVTTRTSLERGVKTRMIDEAFGINFTKSMREDAPWSQKAEQEDLKQEDHISTA